jgi:hypothetical protein
MLNETIIACICVMLFTIGISFDKELSITQPAHLSYERVTITNPDEHAILFEKYDKTKNGEQRRERLDAFALYLRENPHFRGYIMTYGGRRSCTREALRNAEDARNYLVKIKGIAARRLVVLDGGYHEEWTVELWAGTNDGTAPTPLPTVDSKEVKVRRNCSDTNNSHRRSPKRIKALSRCNNSSTLCVHRRTLYRIV